MAPVTTQLIHSPPLPGRVGRLVSVEVAVEGQEGFLHPFRLARSHRSEKVFPQNLEVETQAEGVGGDRQVHEQSHQGHQTVTLVSRTIIVREDVCQLVRERTGSGHITWPVSPANPAGRGPTEHTRPPAPLSRKGPKTTSVKPVATEVSRPVNPAMQIP
jgi:hypothetical protein